MPYEIEAAPLPGVLILRAPVYEDQRGFFLESFNQRDFDAAVGRTVRFVQDNHSRSRKSVLRGMHYQLGRPQGKLVRVVRGEVFDVAVDLRKCSETFGGWIGVRLSEENRKQLWIPEGFAHGFLVLTERADVLYKTTEYWSPEHERTLLWSDPQVGIEWPLATRPLLAKRDACAPALAAVEVYP